MAKGFNPKKYKVLFLDNFKKKTRNMTVDEVCELLKVEKRTLQSWRSDGCDTMPRYEDLLSICHKLHCDPNYLFGYSDSYNLQYKEITEVTGLSSAAIDTLNQESHKQKKTEDGASEQKISEDIAKEDEDMRRIDMLNRLLSNRKAFTELMDCLISLYQPTTYSMDRSSFLKYFFDSESDSVTLPPSAIKQLSADTPENVHHRIRVILDDFIKQIE